MWHRHNLMKSEFLAAQMVVSVQILQFCHVIGIVNINLELLLRLKLEFDRHGGDKLWIERIKDALSGSNLDLLTCPVIQLPKNSERVTLRLIVGVRQIVARNLNHHDLREWIELQSIELVIADRVGVGSYRLAVVELSGSDVFIVVAATHVTHIEKKISLINN